MFSVSATIPCPARAASPWMRIGTTELRSSVELGSAEAIKLCAAEGLGLGCLSRHAVADFVALGRLSVLRTTLPPLHRELSLILHQQKFVSPAMERFIAHCHAA